MTALANAYSDWLDNLATHDPAEVGPPPSIGDVLSNLGEVDPRIQGLLRFFALREQEEDEEDETFEPEPDDANGDAPEVRAVVERLYAEVSTLRERNDQLAAALGACHLCWGSDRSCPRCGGGGAPGCSRPEPVPFATWVVPAVRRVRAVRPPDRPSTASLAGNSPPERSINE